ncbi:unnamed protein product [Fusarium equiseti]|uniref:Uncharacterized protein n=1 Tax=Fusarium equiseti TaxID=61235 RepID=A0A8J2IGU7_FUSEQ|nr:unnamed protein product [Fusarium equiseti]
MSGHILTSAARPLTYHRNEAEDLGPEWGQSGVSFPMGLAIRHVLWIIAQMYPQELSAAIDAVKPGWSSSQSALDFFDPTVLPCGLSLQYIACKVETVLTEEQIVVNEFIQPHRVRQTFLQEVFFNWMVHVMDLAGHGMPMDSYTLTLDGDPDLNYSTEIFTSFMKHEIAELTMNSDIVAQSMFASPEHLDHPFMTRQFMTEVCPVSDRSSLLQCNFTLDQPWDYKKIVEENDVEPHSIDLHHPHFADPGYFDVLTPSIHFLVIKLEYYDREWLTDSTDETMREYGDEEWITISSV